uniref:Ig-like domain-containing protein n=1 Tax=Buteo japonicus TaxID=224669 RepID=A0A8C0B308_9AVES
MTRVGTLGTSIRVGQKEAQILSEVMNLSLILVCCVDRGPPSVSWLLRGDQKEDPRVHISNCRNNTRQSCSMLVIRKVIANDTGYFTSFYGQLPAQISVPFWSLTSKGAVFQINVLFPADSRNPFVEIHPEHPEIIYILDAKKTVVIPCRVTSPDIKPKDTLLRMVWDPRKGFVIPSHSFVYSGVLTCTANVNGSVFTSYYLGRVQNLALKATPKKLLVGETLYLECKAETFINGRIELIWTYLYCKKSRVDTTQFKDVSTVLWQICHYLSSSSFLFPDKPFITVSHKKGPYYEITSGHKSLKLAAKVDAFPRPSVTWYKDGKLIKDNHTCYEPDPMKYRLGIRDVRPKHAGNYTIVLSNAKYGLYKNLTMQLVVTERPKIYEKETDFDKIERVELRSKHKIQCTVSGNPDPKIEWKWQPCSLTDMLYRLLSSLSAKPTLHSKPLLLLFVWQIVSTLTTENSSASGIYYCVASNKIGEEERSIEFYVSDVPFGLQTDPQVTTIVGNDVRLTCRASKYIYSHLAWYYPSSEAALRDAVIKTTDNYSISLTLVITNITKEQSGLYKCRAQNQHNSTDTLEQHTHQGAEDRVLQKPN